MVKRTETIAAVILIGVAALAIAAGVLYYGGVFDFLNKKTGEEENIVRYVLQHDEAAKTITWSGDDYTVRIGYNKKAAIEMLKAGGRNILDEKRGIYLGYTVTEDKKDNIYSGLELPEDPEIAVDNEKNTVTLSYGDEYTQNVIDIQLNNKNFDISLKRTVIKDVKMADQSFPSINLEQDLPESIRFERSGSNFWVGCRASEQKNFLAAGNGYRETKIDDIWLGNIRRAIEDITFTVLIPSNGEKTSDSAVSFSGTLINQKEKTEFATQVQRVPVGDKLPLALDVIVSGGSALKCNGNVDGWGSYSGKTSLQGGKIYQTVKFNQGDVTELAFRIECKDYDSYYDLGTLNGVNEEVLSKIINDYSRMMIMDWNMGTTLEQSQRFFELPALEQHWNTNLLGIYGDDAAIAAQKNGLLNIKKYLQAKDGHITSPYPGSGSNGWGWNYSDMMPGYVISIIDTYILSGDRDFLDAMRKSAEKALEAQVNMYISDNVYLCKNLTVNNKINPNDYWEHNSGKYNGYTTPMFYQALMRFAEIERKIYSDEAMASYYEELAAKIRKDYNEMMWSEESGTFLYGSESKDIAYLPVQAAVLASNIAYEGRNERIIAAVERDTAVFDLGYHVLNILDLQNGKMPADQSDDHTLSMTGMNGGWYGAPDGEFYAAFPIYGDRTLIEKYINGLVKQFEITGFINATCYKRDGVSPGDYGWWDLMPTMAYPIYGLYRYGYGFAPTVSGLNIEPFISENMIGSVVNYRWRGADMTVTYNGLFDFTVNIPSLPTDVYVRFINQTPGKDYSVSINGQTKSFKADENGVVAVKLDNAGTTNVVLNDPDSENDVESGVNVALGKPVAASSTLSVNEISKYWSSCLTDGEKTKFWRAEGNLKNQWLRVALGRKYDVGTFKMYVDTDNLSFKYVIEGTNDPAFKNWTVLTNEKGTDAAISRDNPLSVSISEKAEYSYIRIRVLSNTENTVFNVTEIEINAK